MTSAFFVLHTGQTMRLLLLQLFGLDERRRYHKAAECVHFLVEGALNALNTDIVDRLDRTALHSRWVQCFQDRETQ